MAKETADRRHKAAYFQQRIRNWARPNLRQFPWRDTRDPYSILIAEMMLRRTQAKQVLTIYEDFMAKAPNIRTLAAVPANEVKLLLRPLGLSWRVPQFRLMARTVLSDFAGQLPTNRKELLTLPGVGEYVADAVRCLALNTPGPVVDTNTVRVAGRYFGFSFGPESRRRKDVRAAVFELVGRRQARLTNLAVLDFAAAVCTARSPGCAACPVKTRCSYFKQIFSTNRPASAPTLRRRRAPLGKSKSSQRKSQEVAPS